MKLNLADAARMGAVVWLVFAAGSLPGAEPVPSGWRTVQVVQTNRSPRVVTNVIEVRVPENVFVDEYRTNWFRRTVTNIVEVPVTNWATKSLTNRVAVTLWRTNAVSRYQTNWTTLTRTNREEVALTNWNKVTLVRTNVMNRYQTNWETVRVTRTNYIRQPATNFIEVNVPAGAIPVQAREPARPAAPRPEAEPAPVPETLVMDATRTARPADSGGAEVNFKVRLSGGAEVPLQVQQWRVEREDQAVVFFSQAREFKRALPPGKYQVQVRARREGGPLLSFHGGLEVTADAVTRR